jgi:DNA-binding transcriptional ArsR family regulator
MLEFFIPSAARRKILVYLLSHPEEEHHLREFSRRIKEPAPVVKRELDKLDRMGLVISWNRGNQRRFKANRNFALWPEIKSFVDKSQTLSAVPKVSATYILQEIPQRRKSWGKRSKEIIAAYGNGWKRKRPRHPSEAKLLGNRS